MNLQKPEMDLAEQFIRQLTARFEPEQYKDEYQQRVLDLIETKRAGQVVAGQPPKPKLAPVIDLMEALKKSIAERGAPAAVPGLVALLTQLHPTWSSDALLPTSAQGVASGNPRRTRPKDQCHDGFFDQDDNDKAERLSQFLIQ